MTEGTQDKLEKPQEERSSLKAQFEIDPSFPQKEVLRLEVCFRRFKDFVEWMGIDVDFDKIKIFIFPEEKIKEMNEYIQSQGGYGALGFFEEKGKSPAVVRRSDSRTEVFLAFGPRTVDVEEIVYRQTHELVHIIEGEQELETLNEKATNLVRKPIGSSERDFALWKEMLDNKEAKAVCYVTRGLKVSLKTIDREGTVFYHHVRGEALNEFIIEWLALIFTEEEFNPQKFFVHKVVKRVVEEFGSEVITSFILGSPDYLRKVFEPKFGFSFDKYCEMLDETIDIILQGNYSKEAKLQAKGKEKGILVLLGVTS